MKDLLSYVYQIPYEEKPNYTNIKGMLHDILMEESEVSKWRLDWNKQYLRYDTTGRIHSALRQESDSLNIDLDEVEEFQEVD